MPILNGIKLLSGNRTELYFEEKIAKGQNHDQKEETFKSTEVVHPDFNDKASELIPLIEDVIPFDGFGVEFKSVAIKRSDDSGFAAQFGLWLEPEDDTYSGMQILTPMLYIDPVSGKNKMPELLYEKVQELIKEALAFYDGSKRAQADMFATKEEESKTDEQLDEEEQRKIATPPGKLKRGRALKAVPQAQATAH